MKNVKVRGNSSNSSSIWGNIILVLIIFLLLGCVFGYFCTTNNGGLFGFKLRFGKQSCNNTTENFDTCDRIPNYNNPNFKEERFFRDNNIGGTVPTNPIHVHKSILDNVMNTSLLEHNDQEMLYSQKKKTHIA